MSLVKNELERFMLAVQKCRGQVLIVKFNKYIFSLEQEDELEEGGILLFDLSEVTSINTLDICWLVKLHKKLSLLNKKMILFNVHPFIKEVFEVCKLQKLLMICN